MFNFISNKLSKLFLISFASLFFELLFIRWIPDSIHVISLFGNFTLMSIFVGLGIGLSLPIKEKDENRILNKILLNLFIFSLIIIIFETFKIGGIYKGEYVMNQENLYGYFYKVNIYLVVNLFIALSIYVFIPIGYLINFLFREQKPLIAYSVNIGGSLAGILVFSLLSYLCTPLWIWMLIGMIILMPFSRSKFKYVIISIVLVSLIFLANDINERKFHYTKIWSSYYGLKFIKHSKDFYSVIIGNNFMMSAIDMFNNPNHSDTREFYEFPYLFKKSPENVLILGSGMGNDAAVAIKNGAKNIDVVEIDPKFIKLGKKYHPLMPYLDNRVNIFIGDARTYTKNSNKKYDLIIFGTLDSHGMFSQISSIKMENYVYTLESFREAKKLLKDDGLMYVNTGFCGIYYLNFRIFNCLTEVFGKEPMMLVFSNSILMYLTGNMEKSLSVNLADGKHPHTARIIVNQEFLKKKLPQAFILPTDDWPHLFLKEKKIPPEYGYSLIILFLISISFVFLYLKKGAELNLNYFFLGAGFMLLETKSITEMGLVFGATWLVNSIVIASILIIILVVNLFLLKYDKFNKVYLMYFLLGLSIIISYLFPLSSLNMNNTYLKVLFSAIYISMPFFFASSIFGICFRESQNKSTLYLASNMIGSVFGGIIEYSSMIYGLKALYLFVLGLYFISMLAMMQNGGRTK